MSLPVFKAAGSALLCYHEIYFLFYSILSYLIPTMIVLERGLYLGNIKKTISTEGLKITNATYHNNGSCHLNATQFWVLTIHFYYKFFNK